MRIPALVIATLLAACGPVAAQISLGSVAYFPFSGNALDMSGNGNDGSAVGVVSVPDRFGNPSSAYRFSAGDVIEVADDAALDLTDALTIAAWIQPQVAAGKYVLTKHDPDHGGSAYSLDIYPGTVRSVLKNAALGSGGAEGVTPIQAGVWQHIAVTWDGSLCRVYYDGVEDGTGLFSGTLINTPDPVLIGKYYDSFIGDIDEVWLFERALSPVEVHDLANLVFTDGFEVGSTAGW
jgi:hypothetical protein